MKRFLVLGMVAAVALSGCATKRYGRAVALSDLEAQNYTCPQLEIEISKVHAFQEQIAKGAQIDALSVMGFLGDFGIGNAMERNAAEKSANERLTELRRLKSTKSCPGSSL